MKTLHWMCGKTRELRLQLEMTTFEKVGVTSIIEKAVETQLRWFRHVDRRHVFYVGRRVDKDLEKLEEKQLRKIQR